MYTRVYDFMPDGVLPFACVCLDQQQQLTFQSKPVYLHRRRGPGQQRLGCSPSVECQTCVAWARRAARCPPPHPTTPGCSQSRQCHSSLLAAPSATPFVLAALFFHKRPRLAHHTHVCERKRGGGGGMGTRARTRTHNEGQRARVWGKRGSLSQSQNVERICRGRHVGARTRCQRRLMA